MFCAAKYRGGVRRTEGLKKTATVTIPDSAFIGRRRRKEDGGKRARTVRAKRVPQTPTATVATSQKPDNRGGASLFVLLAVEKNEQINDLFQPLSSETAVPSVSPLYFPTETQGRRLNSSCSPHKNTRPQKKKNPLLPIF